MENAHFPPKKEAGAPNSADSKPQKLRSLRQRRVLAALVRCSGWIPREGIDTIAGASNGPQVIQSLRRLIGYDGIEMERVEATDRDGISCRPGRYRLTAIGRTRATPLLGGGA